MAVSVPFYATWDDDALRRAGDDIGKFGDSVLGKIGKLAGPLAAVGGAIAGAFAFGQIAGFAKEAIDGAVNIGEQLSKLDVLAEGSSKKFDEWSDTTAKAMGIAKGDALEAAGQFVGLFKAAGKVGDEGIGAAQTMVKLASGMASFNNASPEETLAALQSGLRGEFEPLRKYNVLLDDATLKQVAFEKGIISSTNEALTPQQKTLAAYEAIMAQTTNQIDDFTRTSDSAANKQRALGAMFTDTKNKIGDALRPAFEVLLEIVEQKLLPAFDRFADWMVENKEEIALFFERIVTEAENGWIKVKPHLERFANFVKEDLAPVLNAFIEGDWKTFFDKIVNMMTGTGGTKTKDGANELGKGIGGALMEGIFEALSSVDFWKIIGKLLYAGFANSIHVGLPLKAGAWLSEKLGFGGPGFSFSGDLREDWENFTGAFRSPAPSGTTGGGAPPEMIGAFGAGNTPVSVTVNGALDPVSVANQINRILSQRNYRNAVV